jgi:hypothetical protein
MATAVTWASIASPPRCEATIRSWPRGTQPTSGSIPSCGSEGRETKREVGRSCECRLLRYETTCKSCVVQTSLVSHGRANPEPQRGGAWGNGETQKGKGKRERGQPTRLTRRSSAEMYVSQSELSEMLLMWYACALEYTRRRRAVSTVSVVLTYVGDPLLGLR